jgi:isochorismate pyruvate lyase
LGVTEKTEIMIATDCATMADVRAQIDRIDRDIVALIAERTTYIEAAARIKSARGAVHDDNRIDDVLRKTAQTALLVNAPVEIVHSTYRALMSASIAHEFTVFDAK